MRAKYHIEHNNYDLTLGQVYDAVLYSKEWLLIKDDNGCSVLYRANCFEILS